MKAGIKEIIITPDFPALLAGFPEPHDRFNRSVHDDLMAHCFYLESHGTEQVIVTLDLLCYPKWHVTAMREKIEKLTGIPGEACMISTTHTHSGPETRSVPFYPEKEYEIMYPRYINELGDKVAEAVLFAKQHAFEAEIAFSLGHCGSEKNVGGNRREKGGLADPKVWVTSIRDKEKTLRGVIVRYSLHPTFLGAENREITKDYPGYIYEYLKNKHENIAVAFQIGTAGDQSPRFFRSGCTFDEAKRVGYTIAEEAERVLENAVYERDPVITRCRADIEPIVKTVPELAQAEADLAKSERELEEAQKNGLEQGVVRSLECAVIGAKRMLGLARIGREQVAQLRGNHPFEVYLLKIGSTCIVAFPTETFVEYGLDISARSPFENTIVITCTNGYGRGYICTPEAFEQGGYEALGSLYTGENGARLVETALTLLEKVKEK